MSKNKKQITTALDNNRRDRENKLDRKEVRDNTHALQRGVDRKGGGKTEAARRKQRNGQ